MNVKSVIIRNFRAYKNEVKVELGDLTAFVGPNDIGKSSILEALDIFFNDTRAVRKIDKGDINVENAAGGNNDIAIAVEFDNLPDEIVIDETNHTKLNDEYLLTEQGTLLIEKVFPMGGKAKVFIKANHPSNPECNDLLSKKNAELKSIVNRLGLPENEKPDMTKNAEMRKAIWKHYAQTLELRPASIEVTKEDAKNIWEKLNAYMPVFCLFQSDRNNSDSDKEVQDPLKEAVKLIVVDPEVQDWCNKISEKVNSSLQLVADKTKEMLHDMNPDLAETLSPTIPSASELKWQDVFKNVSITGENNIPLNKRGSGVRRLILLNFFRAQAEDLQRSARAYGIIYAIEEPETSQHYHNQVILLDALKSLADKSNVQVIITTHSGTIVKKLDFSNLRLVRNDPGGRTVTNVAASALPYPSLNEINRVAFGMTTEEYHNELYGYIQAHAMAIDTRYSREKEFETWMSNKGFIQPKQWRRIGMDGTVKSPYTVTLQTYIRNAIHHPENGENAPYSQQELSKSIDEMRHFILNGYHV